MAKTKRHEAGKAIADAWREWAQSEEGAACLIHESLRIPPHLARYLENRLWRAFQAGAKAGEHEAKQSSANSRSE